jgi:hypothetical protein
VTVEYDRNKLNFFEKQEPVWMVRQEGKVLGIAVSEEGAAQLPGVDRSLPLVADRTILFRPSLQPIYGGPTLLEALWDEMDSIMERLMTGQEQDDVCGRKGCMEGEAETCEHEDNGDKYRAQELAWVLAIVSNAYDPDVNRIRAEAMERWREANAK